MTFRPQYPVKPIQPIIVPEPEEEVESRSEDRFAAPQQEGFVPTPTPREPDPMTDVTDEDILGKPEDNLSQELTEEDEEEILGAGDIGDVEGIGGYPGEVEEEQPRRPPPRRRLIKRTVKRYPPPPTTLGGMRY